MLYRALAKAPTEYNGDTSQSGIVHSALQCECDDMYQAQVYILVVLEHTRLKEHRGVN